MESDNERFVFHRDVPIVNEDLRILRRDAKIIKSLAWIAAIESAVISGYYIKDMGAEYGYVLLACSAAAALDCVFVSYFSYKKSREASELEQKIFEEAKKNEDYV